MYKTLYYRYFHDLQWSHLPARFCTLFYAPCFFYLFKNGSALTHSFMARLSWQWRYVIEKRFNSVIIIWSVSFFVSLPVAPVSFLYCFYLISFYLKELVKVSFEFFILLDTLFVEIDLNVSFSIEVISFDLVYKTDCIIIFFYYWTMFISLVRNQTKPNWRVIILAAHVCFMYQ